MHKVEVSLHVNIEISEDKKVTLGNIATAIKGLAAVNIKEATVKIVITGAELVVGIQLLPKSHSRSKSQ